MTSSGADADSAVRPSLLSNSRWNLFGFACGIAAHFITIPFVVKWIGLPAFGRAGLILAITAPLTLIGSVIGQAVVREVSSQVGSGDVEGAFRTTHAALWLCIAAGCIGWVTLVLAGPGITRLILGSELLLLGLSLSFVIAASGWLAQQFALVLQAGCVAKQDFRTVARAAALSGTATVASVLALTAAFPTVDGYLAGVAMSFVLTLACWAWIRRHDLRLPLIALSRLRSERQSLMHFGKWQGVAQLAGAFGNQIDRYALGALAPIAVVGQYNVANRLQEAAYVGVIKAGEVLFPHFGSVASKSIGERARAFQVTSWVVATFSAMLLAPLAPLASDVLALWIGPEGGADAAVLLRTLVLGGIVGCGSNVFVYYAMGMGQNVSVAWISVMYSVVTVMFTILLIRAYGPLAAGAGLLVASVARVVAALFVIRREFFPQLQWIDLLVSSVLPLAIGVAIALGVDYLGYAGAQDWPRFAAAYIGLAALVLTGSLLASVTVPGGRAIVASVFSSLRANLGR